MGLELRVEALDVRAHRLVAELQAPGDGRTAQTVGGPLIAGESSGTDFYLSVEPMVLHENGRQVQRLQT